MLTGNRAVPDAGGQFHGVLLTIMMTLLLVVPAALTFAALGYSLIYLLCGGGLFGAIVIFFVAKMLGK